MSFCCCFFGGWRYSALTRFRAHFIPSTPRSHRAKRAIEYLQTKCKICNHIKIQTGNGNFIPFFQYSIQYESIGHRATLNLHFSTINVLSLSFGAHGDNAFSANLTGMKYSAFCDDEIFKCSGKIHKKFPIFRIVRYLTDNHILISASAYEVRWPVAVAFEVSM